MDERLTTIKGIGPGREKQLHKLGITNITSLLTYFPRTYEDRRTIYRIGDLKSGMTGGVVGNVIAVQEKRPRPRLSILEVVIADGTGPLKIVLFNQGYKKNFYKKGQRLYAYGKAEFQYGKIEICARFTKTAKGGWPAIWMMPAKPVYSGWPACGEIDIMENVGYDPDTIVGSSHTEKYNHAIGTQKNAKIACPDCYKAFHVYALEWEEDEYRLYVDDQLYFTFKNEGTGYEVWPYDKRFHILLNLAIGGNWGGQKGIDDSLFPHVFEIDYVRVYKK